MGQNNHGQGGEGIMKAVVAPWKKEEVKELKEAFSSPVVGLVDIGGIPARQMLEMRQSLRTSGIHLKSSRITLLKRVVDEISTSRPGLESMNDLMAHKQLAVLTTEVNPFNIYQTLEKSKSKGPAKGGETADEDIVIEKGSTGFPAGPIVGDFQSAGFPAAIEKGEVVIRKKHTAVNKGEEISADIASALTKLEIYPIEMGMDLLAAFDGETFYLSDVLNLDLDLFNSQIQSAAAGAFNLAVNVAYPTTATISVLLATAQRNSLALALSAKITNSTTVKQLLAEAYSSMLGLASQAGDGLDDELKDRLGSAQPAPAAAPEESTDSKEEDSEDEEEEEEVSEEDAAAGLGALFG